MRLQILKIVLWPSRSSLPPRVVALEKGRVNVISGASKTGKSAIIPIIDYCLASDRCAIPVETIRNACRWFGVLVETEEGQKLLARREPGNQRSTGDMYILEGTTVTIPDSIPDKNTTADNVKSRLDELCGLSRLDFDFDGTGSGFKGRPSFRDLMAFTFQPQNIVANPDVLFFKADTFEHREKLKTIFPYVLNAVTPQVLAAQHECDAVRREIVRKERELTNLRQVSERWNAELRAWALQARELGFVENAIPANASRDVLITILQEAIRTPRRPSPNPEGIGEAMAELAQLQAEERTADNHLRALHRRLAEMSKLRQNVEQFGASLGIQRDRLALAKWLRKLEDTSQVCPICASTLPQPSAALEELYASLTQLENDLTRTRTVPASFDREFLRVRQEIQLYSEKLKGIGLRRAEVDARSGEARAIGFRETDASRFIGRVEKGLEMQEALDDDGTLTGELEALRARERELAAFISGAEVERRKKRALERVASFAAKLLPSLDAERPNDPIELSTTDLTVRVKGVDREDFLWEIGSGANWLSYHVAVSLGLQQFFIESPHNPVPSFLVYDQPSQVYFPRKLARPAQADDDPAIEDEDIEAVRKVFHTFAQITAALKHKLQILVLDHAGTNVWGSLSGLHLVEEWRDGRKLVPETWL
jgi:Protein of unknown function (DUF3732)